MAAKKDKTDPLPGMTGKGVAPLSIGEIDKAINAYERKKEKRCEASPGEISAKRDLTELLIKNRDKLPVDENGRPFYRYDGVDYIIEDVLKRRKTEDDEPVGVSGHDSGE